MTTSCRGGQGVERLCKRKKDCEHGQQCIDGWGEGSVRGLNGNGKNTLNFKSKNLKKSNRRIYSQHNFYCLCIET